MGGRDNITVVMFRLAGDDELDGGQDGEAVSDADGHRLARAGRADTGEVAAARPA